MKIIDFGRAAILDPTKADSCTQDPTMYRPYFTTSVWEMKGCQYSYRDDIFRIFRSISRLMHGSGFSKKLMTLGREETIRRLETGEIFDTDDGSYTLDSIIAPDKVEQVRSVFQDIIMNKLLIIELTEKPDYVGIIEKLNIIRSLAGQQAIDDDTNL